MRYLIVLRGLPASGKSSYIKENNLEPYTLSSDKYRLLLSSFVPSFDSEYGHINQNYNAEAWKRLYNDLEFRMKHGEFTIVDATHMTKKSLQNYRKLCKMYYYRMIVVNFDVDAESCIERDKNRACYSVGKEVIEKMAEKKEELPKSIKQIQSDELRNFLDSVYMPIILDNYNKIHIIGDIHGCYSALEETFKDADEDNDAFIFVGDYFDRGIENDKVFNYIYDRLNKNNFFFLRGNHELKIESYLRGEDISKTQFYRYTLQQFKKNNITDKMLSRLCYGFIPCANFYFNGKQYIVSHGGLISNEHVNIFTSDDVFVRGVGNYEDMEQVCKYWENNTKAIQVFGHRNNNDIPIKANNQCYNICGFPEHGGDLKSIIIDKDGIYEKYITNKVFSKENYYKAISKYPDRFVVRDVETLVGAFRNNRYVNETKFGDISSFQFSKDAFYKEHWGHIVNKARGLFINTKTYDIVARSYDKFFLLGQYDYCTLDKFTPPFTVYKKYDGFLGIIGYDEESDSILYCNKSTLAPWGDYANLFKSKIEPLIKNKEALKCFLYERNCSLVFECIAPKEDEHIIKYDSDKIILLDVVDNNIKYRKYEYTNYTYFRAEELFDGIDIKEKLGTYPLLDIPYLKNFDGEGWVIEDKYGNMFKLKTYQYEINKILRNIKDIYKKIKEKSLGHEIKCPSKDKIQSRYCQYYSDIVVKEVIKKVPDIIKEVNNNE